MSAPATIPGGPRVLVVPSSYFARDRTVGGGERYAPAQMAMLDSER